jgi:hypothetical protein
VPAGEGIQVKMVMGEGELGSRDPGTMAGKQVMASARSCS